MDIYSDVAERLAYFGLDFSALDDYPIRFAMKQAQVTILTNINRPEVPEELRTVFVDMACGYFLQSMKAFGRLDIETLNFEAPAKSIKEGDVQVTYAAASEGSLTPEARFDAFVNALIHPKPGVFTHFRRLTW